MKILAIATLYPNESQPVHALFVEQRMRALAARVPVEVICPVPWFPVTQWLPRYRHRTAIPRAEVRHGIRVHYPRFVSIPRFLKPLDGPFLLLSVLWTAWRLRGRFAFDRIEAHLAFPDGWAAVWLGRLFRSPVTVTLRGHDVNDLPEYPVRKAQVSWTLRNADQVFAVADALRDGAVSLGASPDRVETVGNGVDPAAFRPRERREARAEIGLGAGTPEGAEPPLIVAVGHLVERKGFHHIVRALPVVRARHPAARLLIVGAAGEEGDYSAEIRSAVAEVSLENAVTFAGAVGHDRLGAYYAAADVFCLASAKEGRANVLLEALACGAPIVATRVWGTPEIVSDDAYGILVEHTSPEILGGALADALDRDWDRDAIVEHGRGFSWEGAADQILAAMTRIGEGR